MRGAIFNSDQAEVGELGISLFEKFIKNDRTE
jgi:hypothetical protein